MAQIDDLKAASAKSVAQSEKILALVQKLVLAAQTPSAEIQAVIDELNGETAKEQTVLDANP